MKIFKHLIAVGASLVAFSVHASGSTTYALDLARPASFDYAWIHTWSSTTASSTGSLETADNKFDNSSGLLTWLSASSSSSIAGLTANAGSFATYLSQEGWMTSQDRTSVTETRGTAAGVANDSFIKNYLPSDLSFIHPGDKVALHFVLDGYMGTALDTVNGCGPNSCYTWGNLKVSASVGSQSFNFEVLRGNPGSFHQEWSLDANSGQQLGLDIAMHSLGTVSGANLNYTFKLTGIEVTPVPEPETYALFLAGLGLLGAIARRRKVK